MFEVTKLVEVFNLLLKHERKPTQLCLTDEPSVLFQFDKNDQCYLIEVYHDGDIVFVERLESTSLVFDVDIDELELKILEIPK